MKQTIEKYFCDLCKRETPKHQLRKLKLPLTEEFEVTYVGTPIRKMKKVIDEEIDCCEECRMKLNKLIEDEVWVEEDNTTEDGEQEEELNQDVENNQTEEDTEETNQNDIQSEENQEL